MSPRADGPRPGRIVITEDQLRARIAELGAAIARDYAGQNPVLVGVLQGAFLFMADLIRATPIDLTTDFIGLSSYGSGTTSSGQVRLVSDLSMSIEDRHVLIVEDIVDTGLTLAYLKRNLEARHPRSVRVCVLADKVGAAGGRGGGRLRGVHRAQRLRGGLRLRLRRRLPESALRGGAGGGLTERHNALRQSTRGAILGPMNQVYKNLALWMVIGLIVILLFTVFQGSQQSGNEPPNFSEFLRAVEQGRVESVQIRGNLVTYYLKDSAQPQRTYIVEYPDLIKMLRDRGVRIAVKPPDANPWYAIFLQWVPMLLFIGVWIFFMRQMQGGGAKALSFGKARARLISEKQNKVTFQDVAGVDEAKEELREIIDFLKDPQKFQKLGGKIPKGVLLVGPPGTGKTLLARAIAGEANVPFFTISGSDFVEMFVGVGASRVRDLFEQGKKHAPCIIFMDEIDAVGRHRGAGLGGGHDEREQTLNQLLVEMDGFETNEGVILIAATNRPDVLDPALLRPGRFDRQVVVPRPDVRGREEILRVHARRIPLAPDVELKVLARGTPGFSGADLANLVNEAALLAARQNKKLVEMPDFEYAKDKVLMGVERRSMIISETEKRTIAYHEAGHALVADVLPGTDPLHKVTIIPRGRALGLTMQLPMDDKYNYSRDYLINRITILMGGRTAEEMVLNQQTTGAGRRPREGYRDGPQDGLRVGHVRQAGAAHLRQERGAHLPGAGGRAPEGLQRGHGDPHRPRDQADRPRLRSLGRARSSSRTSTSSTPWRAPSWSASRSTARRSRGSSEPSSTRAHPRPPERHGRSPPGVRECDRGGLRGRWPASSWAMATRPPSWESSTSAPSPFTRAPFASIRRRSSTRPRRWSKPVPLSSTSGRGSTAPYLHTALDEREEAERLSRAVELLATALGVPVSADTTRAGPARAALGAGARVINDVSGLADPELARLVAEAGAGLIAMAWPTPGSLWRAGPLATVATCLRRTLGRARAAGVVDERIVLDPGIGFFRGGPVSWVEWDVAILAGLERLLELGRPLCVAVSRKSFLGALTGRDAPGERLAGSLAATALAVAHGASLIRSHDVRETLDAVRVAARVRRR